MTTKEEELEQEKEFQWIKEYVINKIADSKEQGKAEERARIIKIAKKMPFGVWDRAEVYREKLIKKIEEKKEK